MNTYSKFDAQSGGGVIFRRLTKFLIDGQRRQVVRQMRLEATGALEHLILEAEADFDPVMAREIERMLRTNGAPMVRLSETLMPRMRVRFNVSDEQFDRLGSAEHRELKRSCNACPGAARCWQALRDGEDKRVCQTFCPNAETFEQLSAAG